MSEHQKVFFFCARGSCRLLHWIALVISGLLLVTIGMVRVPVAQASSPLVVLTRSVPYEIAHMSPLGHHNPAAPITAGVFMQTNHSAEMYSLLKALTNRHSLLYHHWLKKGEFDQRFGPTSSQLTAVTNFLRQAGLHIIPSSSGAKIVLFSGTSGQMEATFHTTINDYAMANGKAFFANSTHIQIPATLQGAIQGVFGLSNAPLEHPADLQSAKGHPNYGGGPNGTGLTPSQIAGIYDVNPIHAQNTGQGLTAAVFELSGYTPSDIQVYESQFGLPNVSLSDISVNGGPTGSTGAGEVELDLEMLIAMAPGLNGIEVYNAPNTGMGVILAYQQIATDNTAQIVSTSWGLCEANTTSTLVSSENTAAMQMAMQGQSVFAATGDSGAYECGNSNIAVQDPSTQPYFTAVGGTSFGSFNPGSDSNPTYPTGQEVIWNNGCSTSGCKGSDGGGVSTLWGDPGFQAGAPGVDESGYSQSGSYCNQSSGMPCREVPDVALNADPQTGYSVYCTNPGDSLCRGWGQIGGTSAAAPLWAGIAALLDVQQQGLVGQFTSFLYQLDPNGYNSQYHDITRGDNGFYPAGADYDMASGLGTPDIALFVQNP